MFSAMLEWLGTEGNRSEKSEDGEQVLMCVGNDQTTVKTTQNCFRILLTGRSYREALRPLLK